MSANSNCSLKPSGAVTARAESSVSKAQLRSKTWREEGEGKGARERGSERERERESEKTKRDSETERERERQDSQPASQPDRQGRDTQGPAMNAERASFTRMASIRLPWKASETTLDHVGLNPAQQWMPLLKKVTPEYVNRRDV